MGAYSDLQRPSWFTKALVVLILSSTPTPNICLTISYQSLLCILYYNPMACLLYISGIFQPLEFCTYCSPYLEYYCPACLSFKFFSHPPSCYSKISFLVLLFYLPFLSLQHLVPWHFISTFPYLVFFLYDLTYGIFCFYVHFIACFSFDPSECKVQVQLNSVTQSCPTLCDPTERSTPGFPVHHQILELAQTHVHWIGDKEEDNRWVVRIGRVLKSEYFLTVDSVFTLSWK